MKKRRKKATDVEDNAENANNSSDDEINWDAVNTNVDDNNGLSPHLQRFSWTCLVLYL